MKRLLFLLCLLFSVPAMAQIPIIGHISTNGPASYPTHLDSLGKGGYMAVADTNSRNSIPTARRKQGMMVFTVNDNKVWVLAGGVANSNWTPFLAGGLSFSDSTAIDLNEATATLGLILQHIHDAQRDIDDVDADPLLVSFVDAISVENANDWQESNFVAVDSTTGEVYIIVMYADMGPDAPSDPLALTSWKTADSSRKISILKADGDQFIPSSIDPDVLGRLKLYKPDPTTLVAGYGILVTGTNPYIISVDTNVILGGPGGATIYNSNGSITGDRTVNAAGNDLRIWNSPYISIEAEDGPNGELDLFADGMYLVYDVAAFGSNIGTTQTEIHGKVFLTYIPRSTGTIDSALYIDPTTNEVKQGKISGGGASFYTSDGTLTGDRAVNANSNDLYWNNVYYQETNTTWDRHNSPDVRFYGNYGYNNHYSIEDYRSFRVLYGDTTILSGSKVNARNSSTSSGLNQDIAHYYLNQYDTALLGKLSSSATIFKGTLHFQSMPSSTTTDDSALNYNRTTGRMEKSRVSNLGNTNLTLTANRTLSGASTYGIEFALMKYLEFHGDGTAGSYFDVDDVDNVSINGIVDAWVTAPDIQIAASTKVDISGPAINVGTSGTTATKLRGYITMPDVAIKATDADSTFVRDWSDGGKLKYSKLPTYVLGSSVFSGDAVETTFTVTHGLGTTPSQVIVQGTSAVAVTYYVTNKTSTTFDVEFITAPATGTNNITFDWIVK